MLFHADNLDNRNRQFSSEKLESLFGVLDSPSFIIAATLAAWLAYEQLFQDRVSRRLHTCK